MIDNNCRSAYSQYWRVTAASFVIRCCSYADSTSGDGGAIERLVEAIEAFEVHVGSVDADYSGHPARARGIFDQRDDDEVEDVA